MIEEEGEIFLDLVSNSPVLDIDYTYTSTIPTFHLNPSDQPIITPSEADQEDSSSSASSSDDDEESLLMQKLSAPSSDSDDDSSDEQSSKIQLLHTRNEILVPCVAPIDIVITPEMSLDSAGHIHMLVEDQVVIKASFSGFQRVLEDGTVLVFEDRSILGRIFETFGPVSAPMFSVRFNNGIINRADMSIGRKVFYIPDLSVWTLTDQLRRMRGCDASNQYDEEVVDVKEMEFSDDEQEREFRQQLKSKHRIDRPKFVLAPNSVPQHHATTFSNPNNHNLVPSSNQPLPPTFDYGCGSGRGGRRLNTRSQVNETPHPPEDKFSVTDLFARYATPRKQELSESRQTYPIPPPLPNLSSSSINRCSPMDPKTVTSLGPVPPQTYPIHIETQFTSSAKAPCKTDNNPPLLPEHSFFDVAGPPVNALSLFQTPPKHSKPLPTSFVPPAHGFVKLQSYNDHEPETNNPVPVPPTTQAPGLTQILDALQALQAYSTSNQQPGTGIGVPADTLNQIMSVLNSVAPNVDAALRPSAPK